MKQVNLSVSANSENLGTQKARIHLHVNLPWSRGEIITVPYAGRSDGDYAQNHVHFAQKAEQYLAMKPTYSFKELFDNKSVEVLFVEFQVLGIKEYPESEPTRDYGAIRDPIEA